MDELILKQEKRNNKKKTKVVRVVCSTKRLRHNVLLACSQSTLTGLIPFPFGLPSTRFVELLSFSFFRFFCFLLK